MEKVARSSHGIVGRRGFGHVEVAREELDSATNAFGMCLCDKNAIAAIVLWGMANIPSVNAVGCPRFALAGSLMEDDFCAEWRHGRSVKIKGAVEMCVGGEAWIETGAPE